MDPRNSASAGQPSKLEAQLDLIVRTYRERGMDIGVALFPDGDLDFIYQRGVILVRSGYLAEVRRVVGGGGGQSPPPGPPDPVLATNAVRQPDPGKPDPGQRDPGKSDPGQRSPGHAEGEGALPGITLYSLAGARLSDTLVALDAIDRELGPGIATPNHFLSVTPVLACPATEPGGVPFDVPPEPGPCDPHGRGVHIYVPDTGLLDDATAHPWLAGVTGNQDKLPLPDSEGLVIIPEYAGHGTFVAGVARCMAPHASVFVTDDFTVAGAISEYKMVHKLNHALGLGVNIISLSAGCTTRHNLPLLSFESFWDRYRYCKGVQLVAAAGNNSSRRPFWPAAFTDVVGVGALAADGLERAHFSDFGPWVDVYAPGQDLVNAYARGMYIYREPPHIGQMHEFHGMARWSGTSFATPLVSGLIAARMTRTGENARQAAVALLAAARAQHVPGVGPVLLPCDTGDCEPAGSGGQPDGY